MEENEMDIFGEGFEINLDNFEVEEHEEEQEQEEIINEDQEDPNKKLGEDESSEEVSEEEDESSEGDDGESSPNLYSSLATVLYDEGLLPSLDLTSTEIKSPAELAEAFKAEINRQSELRLEEYLENIDLSKIANSKRAIQSYNEITDERLSEDAELAKNLIYNDYINQGLSEDRASKLLNKLVDLGEESLIEEAKESLGSLKVFEQRQLAAEKESYETRLREAAVEQEKIQKQIKENVYKSKEFIEGLPATNSIRDKVYKSMNDVVSKNPETGELENKLMKARRENPLDFDIKLYYLYELTNGFSSFKNVLNTTKSKAVKDLEQTLRQTKIKDSGLPTFLQDGESYSGGIGSELNIN
jgi:hypothetical protein